jgi:hypothetical protein
MKRNRNAVAAYTFAFVVAQLAARMQEEIHA